MAPMDRAWAVAKLRAFCVEHNEWQEKPFAQDSNDGMFHASVFVDRILPRVFPGWKSPITHEWRGAHGRWEAYRSEVVRALVLLEQATEIATHVGDEAPVLDAGQLHPWVWEGARSLWQSGHYREAVAAAARQVNAETQNRYGTRELTEATLFTQAFSDDVPKTDRPRLRLLEDDGGKSAASVRRGIRNYAEGCFAALRNPAAHDVLEELPEHEALEQLAAFSVLARWVDCAQVITAPDSAA